MAFLFFESICRLFYYALAPSTAKCTAGYCHLMDGFPSGEPKGLLGPGYGKSNDLPFVKSETHTHTASVFVCVKFSFSELFPLISEPGFIGRVELNAEINKRVKVA